MNATSAPTIEKAAAVDMLRRFIGQRSGIDRRNYQRDYRDADGYRAFAADYRGILRDGRDARRLLEFVAGRDGITAADIVSATNGNGRLEFRQAGNGWRLDYTTGQYFPTEYRAAACGLLAGIIWRYFRDGGNAPAPSYIRREAVEHFGRGIAGRWFR